MLDWEDGAILEFQGMVYENGAAVMLTPVRRVRENQPFDPAAVSCMFEDTLIILCRDGILQGDSHTPIQVREPRKVVNYKAQLIYNDEGRRDWITV